MTKNHVMLATLSLLMTACSAAALPNGASPAVTTAPVAQSSAAQAPAQPAPAIVGEAPTAAPTHSDRSVRPASETVAAPGAAMLGDAVSCEVRVRRTANGMMIQAVAHADRAVDGDYEFVITKSGGGGSSDVTQSGPFSAAAGETVTLGSTELGADGRYRAVLVLRDQSGELCRQERRS